MPLQISEEGLTFDDVLLLPDYSDFLPGDANLGTHITPDISLNIPLVSAAMDTVTEARMAVALAQLGGIGIIHKNMKPDRQAREVARVKKFENVIVNNPVTISPDATVGDLLKIREQYNISGVPVVGGEEQVLGIVTSRDVRYETDLQKRITDVMTPKEKLVTAKPDQGNEEIRALLNKHRVEKVILVDDGFRLQGLVTALDLERRAQFPGASKDGRGQLRVGAAVGTGKDSRERVQALVEAGADLLVVDTAHGHSRGVLDCVKHITGEYPDMAVIAGNIATAEAATALHKAGAHGVKVGIGPGSICTTRVVTGVGVPQISAIANVANALKKTTATIIADGGIRYSGDIAKALAAGAHAVMLGSMFAGTRESPGTLELYEGRSYKSYRGMGSLGAMGGEDGSSDRYFQEGRESKKLVPEGIEGRVPYRGELVGVVNQLTGGLRAAMGYTGCPRIEDLRTKAKFVRLTTAGITKSHVHDVSVIRQAPNYHPRGGN